MSDPEDLLRTARTEARASQKIIQYNPFSGKWTPLSVESLAYPLHDLQSMLPQVVLIDSRCYGSTDPTEENESVPE